MRCGRIISKCRFFVVARTHATIAAYSTGVPTIVISYSVKSRGIARDLFGDEKGYAVSWKSLINKDETFFNTKKGVRKRTLFVRFRTQNTKK